MRGIISIVLVLLSGVGFSQKQPVIVSTIPSPTYSAVALAHDGENLWVSYYNSTASSDSAILYKVSPLDGSVLDTLSVPSTPATVGMVFVGASLDTSYWQTLTLNRYSNCKCFGFNNLKEY